MDTWSAQTRRRRPPWMPPFRRVPEIFPLQTVAILASGPSLTQEDVNLLHGKTNVIAINDTWRLAPWADLLYACDPQWWVHHKYVPDYHGPKWTQSQGLRDWPRIAAEKGLNVVRSVAKTGVSIYPDVIHTGKNSGFQALNLAILAGAERVILLGYDCGVTGPKTHFFGDHPPGLHRASPYSEFRQAFEGAAAQIKSLGVDVVNCSRETALTCFRRNPLQKELESI